MYKKSNKVRQTAWDPIAIVGIGCRFPGGIVNPATFWEFLKKGGDGIREVPADRWDLNTFYQSEGSSKKGKIYTKKGGFLEHIDQFDPLFFGISPKEANFMDPQQRLLLETTWEALEDGGIVPEKIAGARVGVYVGIFMHDYENMHSRSSEYRQYGPHSATGMSTTIAANRLSYIFDFIGPSIVVDTACSSSLVAVHLACQSLLNGETDFALAGGANVLLRPEMTMILCEAGMLSPDGYCKSFDESANGYTRAEGAAMVVLKRLADAEEAGDPIYAIIKGTAVNQDGNNDGLTIPNGKSQKLAIMDALKNSGTHPAKIQYIEAHGTGTPVGDPIECEALGEIFGSARKEGDHCVIGSVKSNFGHTESAAGVASLIKIAMMLKNKKIPPNLHFHNPNPKIHFDELKLRVPTTMEPWKNENGPRMAAINSFGFGGTNAHAILQEYDLAPTVSAVGEEGHYFVLPISARTPEALTELSRNYRNFLNEKKEAGTPVSLADMAHTLAFRKGSHPCRLGIVASSTEDLQQQLESFTSGVHRPGIVSDAINSKIANKAVFVFSGMGQQWWAMGRQLFQTEPVFRKMVEECDVIFREFTDEWSLIHELAADENSSRMGESRISQPCIFALQVALYELWGSYGVVPEAVVGHSAGEIAAAYVSGILTLKDAAKVCFHRGRLQGLTAGTGKMLAVGLSLEEAERRMGGLTGKVSVAAVNSPNSITLSGDKEALNEVERTLEKENIFVRFLNVDIAFHSPSMDSILDELAAEVKDISPKPSTIPMVSTVTGDFIQGTLMDSSYWQRNVRERVCFAEAMSSLMDKGYSIFIEVGAHPVLSMSMKECLAVSGKHGLILPSLHRKENENITLRASLAKLYCRGYSIDWNKVNKIPGNFLRLPSYPWQRDRYWNESEESIQQRTGLKKQIEGPMIGLNAHPLLGGRIESASIGWQSEIELNDQKYLKDHKVQGTIVFPGAGYVEMGLAAAREVHGDGFFVLENIRMIAPLILDVDNKSVIQLQIQDSNFFIFSRSGNNKWSRHISGSLSRRKPGTTKKVSMAAIQERCAKELGQEEAYSYFKSHGLDYGPAFQGLKHLWLGNGEALGQIEINQDVTPGFEEYILHPVILDACFQIGATLPFDGTYLPVEISKLIFYKSPSRKSWGHVRFLMQKGSSITLDIAIFDGHQNLLVEVQGLKCRRMEDAKQKSKTSIEGLLYEYEWILQPRPEEKKIHNASFMPSPRSINKKLMPSIGNYSVQHEREKFYSIVEPKMDRLCSEYIVEAMKKLGFDFKKNSLFKPEDLARELKISHEHSRLFVRLLELLEKDGILRRKDKKWSVHKQPGATDSQKTWNDLMLEHPDYQAEVNLMARCGSRFSDILTGELDPIAIIFPPESTLAEQFYHGSPTYRVYNRIVQQSVASIIEELPEGQTLRILEIGSGTGSMSSYVLPWLPEIRTHYIFTDISLAFTNLARQKFKQYSFVEYSSLDIEKNPMDQGFELGSFDLILASDAVHATKSLRKTCNNIQSLLAPKGILILLEATKACRWFDLVFGTLKDWWLFEDFDMRPNHPLLSYDKWREILKGSGFPDVIGIADREDNPLHTVIIAQKEAHEPAQPPLASLTKTSYDSTPGITGPCILFVDSGGRAKKLIKYFEEMNITPVIVNRGDSFSVLGNNQFVVNEAEQGDIQKVMGEVFSDNPGTPTVVYMWNLDFMGSDFSTKNLEEIVNNNCNASLAIIQELMKKEWKTSPWLWLLTSGAEAIGSIKDLSLAQAPIKGLARVAVTEFPKFHVRTVDLSPSPLDCEISALAREILLGGDEDEITFRDGKRFVHRMVHKKPLVSPKTSIACYSLRARKSRNFDDFSFHETARKLPGPGQVEIQVFATAMNFKDIALTAGILEPELSEEGFINGLGLECSGIVSAVGAGVTNFKVGDKVMGLAPNGFSSFVVTDAGLLALKPDLISLEEAATITVSFSSAYYALHELADIKKGERILIHTATGGLGFAAIQLARSAGCEVLATAGTPEKRLFLKSMGINYVGDSRSLDFADEIRSYLGGDKVDVVLNTLPGDAVSQGISLLRPVSGRFIELSNIHTENALPFSVMKKGVKFFAFDLLLLAQEKPETFRSALEAVCERFQKGLLHPLPYRAFPASEINVAFKYMRSAKHMGKVLVAMGEADIAAVPNQASMPMDPKGTYLITGGLGGFGLATAKWMASCGARHLVLIGRSGASTPDARQAVEELQNAGIHVAVEAADVNDENRVKEIIHGISSGKAPLKGIVHAAMVLDDSDLMDMTPTQMRRVINPKVLGAWNLHQHTKDMRLDFFISYSSFASLLGNSSQANYSAANAFLDSLSHYHRAQGIPGVSICWGSIGEIGYVSKNKDIEDFFIRQGILPVYPQQAWKAMAHCIHEGLANVGVIPVHWNQMAKYSNSVSTSPRFSHLLSKNAETGSDGSSGKSEKFALQLPESLSERVEALTRILRKEVSQLLGVPLEQMDTDKPMEYYGFDSLLSVELTIIIQEATSIELPKMALLKSGLDINGLAELVSSEFEKKRQAPTEDMATENNSETATISALVNELEEEDLDSLIEDLIVHEEAG
jgi:acyl transferase domain-containing protein/NADPH:quinone reductase-like Zn-dependent oxidoreductase/SAM-dependent methyltransferase/acyl carrier protein